MKQKVQNIAGHAIDVSNGPSLGPGETAEAELTPEVRAAIDVGLLAVVDEPKKSKKEGA